MVVLEDRACVAISNGKITTVDLADCELLHRCNWVAIRGKRGNHYASGRIEKRFVYLHREIVSATKGVYVDHINGDTLDNRRSNLRICSNAQNMFNSSKYRPGVATSKYKGVCFHKQRGKWVASLMFNYKHHHCGIFKTEQEAAMAYNKKAKELFGEFARLNVIENGTP